ncbi:MAG: long-chain-fatty-acid--CoA ligase [Candidatus Tectomicrobia bacterium]|nr:long-chain-fatty-acid--CoA ligase [Candidatus Tectomicrobia bacterium]
MPDFGRWRESVDFTLACRRYVIGEVLAKHARSEPRKLAFVDYTRGKRFSYDELNRRVNRLARALQGLGIVAGDKVAFLFFNSHEIIECYFACAKIGAIAVPLNFRFSPDELGYCLEQSDACCVIHGGDFAATLNGLRSKLPLVRAYVCAEGAAGSHDHDYETLLAAAEESEPGVLVDDDDYAQIFYTSGTTGFPKGALLTHRNYLTHAPCYLLELAQSPGGISPRDVYLQNSPLFHAGGWGLTFSHLWFRNTVVTLRAFDAEKLLECIERERVTITWLVATMSTFVLGSPKFGDYDTSSLRICVSAGSPLPTVLKEKLREKFSGLHVIDVLGQTELSAGIMALAHPEDVRRKVACVGRPLTMTEAKVVDDTGRELPAGEVGEIVYRSPQLAAGYYKKPAETIEAYHDGWFHSGDLARRDDEGFFYLVDRKHDKIVSGGENIFPTEVEEVLYTHPKVENCCVVGVPDPLWGEAVKAVVVLKSGAEASGRELIDYCVGKIADYKKPKSVDFVNDLPRSSVGKVLRREVRAQYQQEKTYYTT